ncbi:predicted protein [Cyanophage PSS2]|uniref:hypothetical protein n=1 Tax=Cyanophage PSS2 TaxID=658401 RepID=UPI0001B04045|nr:hypothetical protein PSS2_gp110 [Cyanophage PSS2]ACT65672.1 hypothetical protein [Cyanophage PSS2]ACY75812.1 predicted protein [Cyanophage PSS2]
MKPALYSAVETVGSWAVFALGKVVHIIVQVICWLALKVQQAMLWITATILKALDPVRFEHSTIVEEQVADLTELQLVHETQAMKKKVEATRGGWQQKHVDDVVAFYYQFVSIGWDTDRAIDYLEGLTDNNVALYELDEED